MRAFVALVVVLVLAVPARANFGGGGQLAKRIATERFPNHCGPYRIDYRPLPHGYLGYVPGGECRIFLSPRFRSFPFTTRCTILTHEFGHLAGLGHSDNPRSVMYPQPALYQPCL